MAESSPRLAGQALDSLIQMAEGGPKTVRLITGQPAPTACSDWQGTNLPVTDWLVTNAPRCELCCGHGVPLSRGCAYCEDADNGYLDRIRDDEPMWDCPHGIGVEPGGI